MNHFLFAALLGCFLLQVYAQRQSEVISITDRSGQCWVCRPGFACEPCPQNLPQPVLDPGDPDPLCPIPDCSVPGNRGNLHADVNPRIFWQCAPDGVEWAAVQMSCQCGTLFDHWNQRCEFPWDWLPTCAALNPDDIDPIECDPTEEPLETTTLPETTVTTTVATTAPPCQCIPWFPCWCMPSPCMPCTSGASCNNGCQG